MSPTGKGCENVVDGRSARDAVATSNWVTYVTPVGEIATAKGEPPRGTGAAPRMGCPAPAGGVPVAGFVQELTSPLVTAEGDRSGAVTPLHPIPSPRTTRRGVVDRAIR